MTGLVPGHIAHQCLDVRIIDVLLDLGIEHAAGEFGGDRADQEIQELLTHMGRDAGRVGGEVLDPAKVGAVLVPREFRHHLIEFPAHRAHVEPIHGRVIGGIETRTQQAFPLGQRRRIDTRIQYGNLFHPMTPARSAVSM